MSARRCRSDGITLAETLVGASLCSLVVTMLVTCWTRAAVAGDRSADSSDAVRSALIALEAIRSDVRRAWLQDPARDLAIIDAGRGLSVRVPAHLGPDFWTTRNVPVTYRLVRQRSGTTAHQLVRREGDRERPIGGCVLSDLRFSFAEGDASSEPAIEVTVAGTSGPGTTFTISARIPIERIVPPAPYALRPVRS